MSKTKLQIMAQRAIEGDQEALDYLKLDESTVKKTTASTLTWETLCANYNFCAHVLVVDSQLNLNTMHRTSHYALQSLTWIARHHYRSELPTIATTCSVEDLAEIMAAVLDHVPPSHLNKNEDVESSSTSELEEEEEEEPAPKKIKKQKEKIEKPEKNTGKEEMENTHSHHVCTRCRMPCCEAMVCDIRRHLMVHVKRGEVDADDVDGCVEVMRHGKRKYVVSKGNPEVRGSTTRKQKVRRKKWCPVPDCTTVCVRLDKHLTRKNKIKLASVPYRVYLRG